MNLNKKIVLTGGPGMGKSSIINYLKDMGYVCIPEVGRKLIKKQIEAKGDKLPWLNNEGFAQEMLQMSIQDYKIIYIQEKNIISFFDRGIIDVIGYFTLCNLHITSNIGQIVENCRYFDQVFITPPWKEIYINDDERKQSFEEAVATYEVMKKVYSNYNYKLIEIPKISIIDRVNFILDKLKIKTNYF